MRVADSTYQPPWSERPESVVLYRTDKQNERAISVATCLTHCTKTGAARRGGLLVSVSGAPDQSQHPNPLVNVRIQCFGKLNKCHMLMTIFNARTVVRWRWSASIAMHSRSFSGGAKNFAAVTASAVSTGKRGIARQSRGNGNGNYRKAVCCGPIPALTGRWSPSVSIPCGEAAGNWRSWPSGPCAGWNLGASPLLPYRCCRLRSRFSSLVQALPGTS